MQKYNQYFIVFSILIPLILIGLSYYNSVFLTILLIISPLLILGYYDYFQKKHAILRNFPIIGHFRYILEQFRPEIMQYFIETDTEGTPFNRLSRTLVYTRAKKTVDTVPFGTRLNVYEEGYEWMPHSIYALNHDQLNFDPRVTIGGDECTQPYSASIFNISAMSFGSLSSHAVMAMNLGAKLGNFAQNTGEGGISPYHLKYGGDIIWQIGTGYFGARDLDGNFSPDTYKKRALLPEVKMIELKLSQGAKPGHGGILPAAKNTPEIAEIRHVKPYTDVNSPPSHSAFHDAQGMMKFIKELRDLSGGKPVGFKLCIGQPNEFDDICQAMIDTSICPDFITVDGGEGGTGAAPIEFSNYVGMPLTEGLIFVEETLKRYGLRQKIKIIASGKIVSGFGIIKAIALGADLCNSARGMMLSVGCIQALECNMNSCPTGVATQDKKLERGLDVEDKSKRVAEFHKKTVHSFVELLGASGVKSPDDINKSYIYRRISPSEIKTYQEIYEEAADQV